SNCKPLFPYPSNWNSSSSKNSKTSKSSKNAKSSKSSKNSPWCLPNGPHGDGTTRAQQSESGNQRGAQCPTALNLHRRTRLRHPVNHLKLEPNCLNSWVSPFGLHADPKQGAFLGRQLARRKLFR